MAGRLLENGKDTFHDGKDFFHDSFPHDCFFGPASLSGAGVAGRVGWGFGKPRRGYASGPAGGGIPAYGAPNLGHTRLGLAGGGRRGFVANFVRHVFEQLARYGPEARAVEATACPGDGAAGGEAV